MKDCVFIYKNRVMQSGFQCGDGYQAAVTGDTPKHTDNIVTIQPAI